VGGVEIFQKREGHSINLIARKKGKREKTGNPSYKPLGVKGGERRETVGGRKAGVIPTRHDTQARAGKRGKDWKLKKKVPSLSSISGGGGKGGEKKKGDIPYHLEKPKGKKTTGELVYESVEGKGGKKQ